MVFNTIFIRFCPSNNNFVQANNYTNITQVQNYKKAENLISRSGEMVDAVDSKSTVAHPTCRFESGLRHLQRKTHPFGCVFLCRAKARPLTELLLCNNGFSPLEKRYLIVFLGTVAFGNYKQRHVLPPNCCFATIDSSLSRNLLFI